MKKDISAVVFWAGLWVAISISVYQCFEVDKIKAANKTSSIIINTQYEGVDIMEKELKDLKREIKELKDQFKREYTNQTLKANQVYTMPMYISTPAILKMNEYPEMFMGG